MLRALRELVADPLALAVLFVRLVLGLIFAMAGFWKTFELGPVGHTERYFLEAFADTWIPTWLLWATGIAIPPIEFVAGVLMCIGAATVPAGIALGGILVTVTYGHLLVDPLFVTTGHIFPRLVLLAFVLTVPRDRDVLSFDRLWQRRRGA
jgi:putative oxidoreductase